MLSNYDVNQSLPPYKRQAQQRGAYQQQKHFFAQNPHEQHHQLSQHQQHQQQALLQHQRKEGFQRQHHQQQQHSSSRYVPQATHTNPAYRVENLQQPVKHQQHIVGSNNSISPQRASSLVLSVSPASMSYDEQRKGGGDEDHDDEEEDDDDDDDEDGRGSGKNFINTKILTTLLRTITEKNGTIRINDLQRQVSAQLNCRVKQKQMFRSMGLPNKGLMDAKQEVCSHFRFSRRNHFGFKISRCSKKSVTGIKSVSIFYSDFPEGEGDVEQSNQLGYIGDVNSGDEACGSAPVFVDEAPLSMPAVISIFPESKFSSNNAMNIGGTGAQHHLVGVRSNTMGNMNAIGPVSSLLASSPPLIVGSMPHLSYPYAFSPTSNEDLQADDHSFGANRIPVPLGVPPSIGGLPAHVHRHPPKGPSSRKQQNAHGSSGVSNVNHRQYNKSKTGDLVGDPYSDSNSAAWHSADSGSEVAMQSHNNNTNPPPLVINPQLMSASNSFFAYNGLQSPFAQSPQRISKTVPGLPSTMYHHDSSPVSNNLSPVSNNRSTADHNSTQVKEDDENYDDLTLDFDFGDDDDV